MTFCETIQFFEHFQCHIQEFKSSSKETNLAIHIVTFVLVLVDKDNNPRWKPATLEEVTQEHVDWYFSELPDERELKLT